jgi:S-DNA-T family DNA segregation ATPase FtsK/SpoIIIE
MRLKLNLSRPDGSHTDLMVTLDADCTVGALAERIANSDPHRPSTAHNPASTSRTLVRGGQSGPVTLNPAIAVLESGLASGSSIALADAPTAQAGTNEVWAVLHVLSGPDAGRSFDLRAGSNTVGRGRQCSVQLADPMVSTLHARIVVGETIEIVDENSSNGILMGDQQVSRVTLGADDTVLLGEDIVSVRPASARITGTAGAGVAGPTIEFNRSPRVDPTYEGEELAPPEPPSPPQKHRFPIVSIVAPVLMAGVLIAVMQNWMFVIFLALSPIMLVGNHIEQKRNSKADLQEATDHFHSSLARVVASAHALHDQERARRGVEHPGTAEILEAMSNLGVLLWTRRPEHDRFMELRLGLGSQPSRLRFDVNPGRNAIPALADELDEVLNRFAYIDRVPIVGSFDVSGSIGVAGPESAAADVARGVMMQVLGLHSPAEVVVCALASSLTAERWEWLKWVPHTSSDHSPLEGAHLASSPPGCSNLVAELTDLVLVRQGEQSSSDEAPLPRVVVLVENDAPVERNRLVLLAEKGPEVGVHLIWVAGHRSQIPAACRSFLEIDAIDGTAATGRVVEGETSRPVLVEPVDLSHAAAIARALSPVVDAGALPSDQTDLPSNVLFLSDAGAELALLPDAVLERWTESRSVFPPAQFPEGAPRPASRRSGGLRALVGRGKGDNVYLDLRTQGPHALVGGTTGSGKSEFLQTWIMGMATAHGPQRVTFLFVDYKGGAAFADCVRLPHCVGLVTDLSPLLVRRALKSLRAELRHREHLLNRYGAKDLLEMEMAGNPETPPSLVIVVDEFAALVQEVPDFVDGVVDVAQRGRSLGLHLILATQRPAGVIKDNLRANTNLRVALRVADEDDSRDVIGTAEAAGFDPSIPGRAVVKSGPGRLEAFQSGYVGGWTRTEAPPPSIRLEVLSFGSAAEWEVPEPAAGLLTEDQGPTDIERLCDQVVEAARTAGLPAPRRPWLPELSPVYELANLQLPRTDTDLAFGVIDDPDAQDQRVVAFHPDVDGNMAVYGTGGSGKSTFLRTIAVAAGLTVRGGPCAVYGLDFGARGLQMLEVLPHVGSIVNGDDDERVARLLRELRETIDDRARRYASAQAGTICEYRGSAGFPDEPRILLLIDGMGAMRAAYESSRQSALLDLLTTIAIDGRQVGVHLVVSADRTGAIPNALAGTIQRNLVLRLASDMDLMTLGAPADGFTRSTPPGRGFVDDLQVQVAVLGGSANVAVQATSIERLAVRLHREGVLDAPVVQSLEDHIPLGSLPVALDRSGMPCDSGSDAEPAFAVADDTLGPVGLDLGTPFLVAGPAGSGRTSTVRTLVSSIGRLRADARFVLLGQRRSTLPASGVWERCALGVDEVARLAGELAEEIEARNAGIDRLVLVVEGIGEFLNTDADYPLVELLKAARSEDLPVIAEGETSTLSGGWPLLSPVKNARHGIVLQPDQIDGDALFSTGFGRMSRADFPPGRGMYVRGGRATRVQVAEA